ncbi:hypothetical protein H9P43_006790 [Blastocladiella emersonii ATCC 22665]|nr:hypothetical protein H9P43_006790 [Blastocladiella emersonii ATCC 22665]
MGYNAQKSSATKKRPRRSFRPAPPPDASSAAALHVREAAAPLAAAEAFLDAMSSANTHLPHDSMTFEQAVDGLPHMEATVATMPGIMEAYAACRPRRMSASEALVNKRTVAHVAECEAHLRAQIAHIKATIEQVNREHPGLLQGRDASAATEQLIEMISILEALVSHLQRKYLYLQVSIAGPSTLQKAIAHINDLNRVGKQDEAMGLILEKARKMLVEKQQAAESGRKPTEDRIEELE